MPTESLLLTKGLMYTKGDLDSNRELDANKGVDAIYKRETMVDAVSCLVCVV